MISFETLETKRLILQALTPADMNFIFENCPKPEIKKILGHRSEEDYQKEAHKQKNNYASYNRSFKLFLLIDKASDTIIGRCGIHNWNVEHRRAEVGYNMEDETFKRKGLMTEALGTIIAHGFHAMNLHRLEALVGSQNVPSLRLMEKYNFVREGLLRQHFYIGGKYEDSVLFSRLYDEYMDEKRDFSTLWS